MKTKKIITLLSAVFTTATLLAGCDVNTSSKTDDEDKQQQNLPTYTVTWVVEGQVVEVDTDVIEGSDPSYDGETPVKEVKTTEKSTISYHAFIGWDKDLKPVTSDITYTAIFNAVTHYAICFSECARTITELFGPEYLETYLDDSKWESDKIISFNQSTGDPYDDVTMERIAIELDSFLVDDMSYYPYTQMNYNNVYNWYSGLYRKYENNTVCLPRIYEKTSTDEIAIRCQFTPFYFYDNR